MVCDNVLPTLRTSCLLLPFGAFLPTLAEAVILRGLSAASVQRDGDAEMIVWNAATGNFEKAGGRERVALHVARRTTSLLTGITPLSGIGVLDVVGATERGRRFVNNGVIGAHLVPHSDIEEMVCYWMNNPVTALPQFLCVIGSLIVPPPSYCTSVPLGLLVGSDALVAIFRAIGTIFVRAAKDQRVAAYMANGLVDFLSNTHTNLRLGDETTNSSIGALVDARIARNPGLDPMAWIELAYQRWMGDLRPRMSAESIYAASLVQLQLSGLPGYGVLRLDQTLSWDSTGAGNANNLRSSVDGAATLRATASGNNILGFLAGPGGSQATFQNPLRRAAHIPMTRIPLCLSWYGLMGLFLMVFLYFQIGILSPGERR